MSIEYRPFGEEDAEAVSCLIKKTLTVVNSMDYPQSVISGLLEYYTPSKLLDIAKNCQFIVALKEGKIVGVGGLELSLIRSLFVEPEFLHQKIGSSILAKLESLARAQQVEVIHVRSSITGMYFYASRGYKIEKEEMTLKSGLNFYMKKSLG